MDGALNPIPTSLCHMITVYGLIKLIAGRNRVNEIAVFEEMGHIIV